ncbi:hypothetical protein [Roseobacter sinensis]|uniref:Heparinase II/III-like protein n=1 Tax=Roseobacter sinensis TaxID=2931391 RepID=A0ABT3BFD8_9RHOB|nr:hypothetical protein [Roseobacter sp. WL0113]MCV3272301.1 hypothetical protein [Roseobacter sp. WL0113]
MSSPRSAGEIARILRETKGKASLPVHADRQAWARLARQHIASEVIAKAEAVRTKAIPPLPLTLFLDYHRTGRREGYEAPMDARRDRLTWMALAEGLEGQGRFLDPIHDMLDAILTEPTWVVPAHGGEFTDGLPLPELQVIDLWSAMACLLVAEVDHMLGDSLHPAPRARLRRAVEARGVAPLLARDDMFWMGAREMGRSSPNWAPVCAGLTAAAAIYLEADCDRLAAVLAKALRELEHYLASFPPDGGCAEGVGYWEKGVFAYACFADLIAARTEGRIDPLLAPHMRQVARFPARIQLGPQRYPLFSDNVSNRIVQTALLRHLGTRLELPELHALDPCTDAERTHTLRYPAEQIRDFLWWEEADTTCQPAPRDWLPDTQIFVARLHPGKSGALALAAKGGTNGEPHNHNDVGSFVISLGTQTPVAEIGAGLYSRQAFDPALRYEMPNYGSHGHSVPEVNGHRQAFGHAFAARDVTCEGDRLLMDIAATYPRQAGVKRLIRRLVLDRPAGAVHLRDQAEFVATGELTSVLITQATIEDLGPGHLALGPLLVSFDPALGVEIEALPPITTRDGRTERFQRICLSPSGPTGSTEINVTFLPRYQGDTQ